MGGREEKNEKGEINSRVLEMDSESALETACMFAPFFFFFKEENIEGALIRLLKTWQNKCVNKTPFLPTFY